MTRTMYFNFSGFYGWDSFLALLPKSFQVRCIARAWLKSMTPPHGDPPNLKDHPMVIQTTWGSFRIVSYSGKVEPCSREHFPI